MDLIKRIRKLDNGRLPILVFSGSVQSVDEMRQLAALGVAGYLNEYSAVEHILPSIAPHLFPGTFHRREHPRVVMGIPVCIVKFALPGSKRELEAEAVVCWGVEKAGIGMQFTKVKAADQGVIDTFVEAHFFRSVKIES
ncbi:MAG: hypothetical protein ABI983_00715 [Acidobacteriota bacterium]